MPLFTKVYYKGKHIGYVEKKAATYVVGSSRDPHHPGRWRVTVKLHGRIVEEKGNIDSDHEKGLVFHALRKKYGKE